MFKKIQDEECYILFGRIIGRIWAGRLDKYTLGQPANVEFDGDYVFDNRARTVGWIHTHPSNMGSPSFTDDTTTHAWCCALGKPLVCCIKGVDGLRAHWYLDDEKPAIETRVYRFGKTLMGVVPQ